MAAVLRVRDNNGNVVDIPAIAGKDGKTPQKGVDYWTDAEKQEIVADVIAALPVYGGEVENIE